MTPDLVSAVAGALGGAIVTLATLRGTAPREPAGGARDQRDPGVAEADRATRLVEALPFAALTVDRSARVLAFNDLAGTLFEVDPARARGRALIEVIPSVELERLVQAASSGETRSADVVFGTGGRERYVGVTVKPYERGAIAIATDRTATLAAQTMRSDFTGNVSHELRTPLSSMKLMLETLMLSGDDAEARALFLPQIQGEVERMIRLVEDLLDLARSESGAIDLRREHFDLREAVAATVATFAQRASAAAVKLELDAGESLEITADRGRVIQVVVNLLDNALRHTPPGGRVAIAMRREGAAAVVSVADTGSGIPFADLPRVFERFYVVDRSRSRDHGGTGLGLAIARHLVELHGGELTVDSIYGQGATFTMRIPLGAPEIKKT